MAAKHQPQFTISDMAELLDIHPQTLRLYERAGLVKPARSRGNTRLYSRHDVARLRQVLYLTRELGVNLAGVEVILRMQQKLDRLQRDIERLRHALVDAQAPAEAPQPPHGALIKASSRMLIKVS